MSVMIDRKMLASVKMSVGKNGRTANISIAPVAVNQRALTVRGGNHDCHCHHLGSAMYQWHPLWMLHLRPIQPNNNIHFTPN